MNKKNLLVSFVTVAIALFLVASVSAGEIATITEVTVDGMTVAGNYVSVVAGEIITLKVYFTALENDTDVTVEAEIEGEKVDVDTITTSFDVEDGSKYKKTLTLKVPYELKDELSSDLALNIEIDGREHKTELSDIVLKVQRPSYNADIKSVSAPQTVEAGETFPVDVVVKNIGYNDLDDLYIVTSILALGIEKSAYFGDLVADEWNPDYDDDETDTWSGRLYLEIPYDVSEGIYALEVEVTNDDLTSSEVKQIVIKNDFSENVIVASARKTVAVGENAEYELLIVNPTDKLKVYRIVTESSGSFSSNAGESVVAVPAGSSKSVKITANANTEGEYNFNVNVFSGEKLVSTVSLSLNAQGSAVTSPIVILTIVLAIIFLVLLVVLIVLITKKPEKTEELGESYY